MDPLVVETSGGKVRGAARNGVCVFQGIPYGADTGGAHRFQPPRPTSWGGIREAFDCGPRSPQNEPPTSLPFLTWLRDTRAAAENCLVLNVYTPSPAGTSRLPVMVYLHGGGFVISSGGTPGVDGCNLARRDVVVVTLNHRLNLFGFLYLGDADGGRYADSGNAGVLDLVAALEWVKENIARFGGDPGNVTIFGQSGGGSKVATLMAAPRAQGLFHKAIIQSASSLLSLATLADAERNTFEFLRQLDLGRNQLRRLHELPAEVLLKAMAQAIAVVRTDHYRPVVDGRTLPCQPFEPAALQLSAGIPLMTGWCENEQRLTYASNPAVYHQSEPQARVGTAQVLGVPEDQAASLMAVYRDGRPQDTPGDLHAQIVGDHRYRRSVTRAAELQAGNSGGAPVYLYLLNWKSPVLAGLLRTPHTLCIAFAFGNVDLATGITGTGADRYRLQDEMAGAWVAFARSGDPNHAGLPAWRPYATTDRASLVFDRETRLVND
ncbi:MAG TPA: carboxylesterase family protein, partial [Ramlibacter sp.]|nr:carboxylesterase family protein [Ramlibacter sp.]